MKLLKVICEREIRYGGCFYVHRSDGEASFRDAYRLHHAGLVTAVMTRPSWDPWSRWPFRELALYADERKARASGYPVMPRGLK